MQNCERLFIENINISIISIKKFECYRDKLYNVGIRQAVIRYGTLIPDSNNLKSDAILVSVCDTMAAILAGFVVIPTAFAGGMEVSKGPALLFDVMAGIYGKLPGGRLIGSAFFIGVAFAVLSSLFTFFEISIRTFEEKLKMGRKKGIIVFAIIVLIGNIFVSLGFGPLSNFKLPWPSFQGIEMYGLYDWLDCFTGYLLLPLGCFYSKAMLYLFK